MGSLKFISESSVAAGVRRIEAITADEAEHYVHDSLGLLDQVRTLLKNPKDLITATKTLLDEKHTLEKQLEVFLQEKANQVKDQLAIEGTKDQWVQPDYRKDFGSQC